ncbi:SMODS domain-containing nucleotidyltransferase [Brucella pseudogrignonensis]|uniref:SMODS domain-containing nucleotidyltransferase n=1 Tax=Brucella pseudogrignonensis TaxID=419475 RepID=UPI0038CF671D
MELKSQFREFLASIRPTERQKEDWRTGSNTLRARLSSDAELGPQIIATFLQGSVRRSTAVRPYGDKRPDVDVVVVTKINPMEIAPADAMNRFLPFLRKFYADRWRPQGRSFGIELSHVDIDLVITALPPDRQSHDAMESLYRSQAVNSLDTLDEQPDWRLHQSWVPRDIYSLNPNVSGSQMDDAPASEWKPNPLFLPDRDIGDWGRTHPLAQIQWTAEKNRKCNSHYVDIVRAIKWWRQTNSESLPKYPKGYPLEHMTGYCLSDGTTSVAQGIVEVFETIIKQWGPLATIGSVPVLSDHGVPEHDVLKRLSAEDFSAFHSSIRSAAEIAREALESDDPQASGNLWRRLLGSRFPLPGPYGGDRSGFTAPSKPAEPRDARFA